LPLFDVVGQVAVVLYVVQLYRFAESVQTRTLNNSPSTWHHRCVVSEVLKSVASTRYEVYHSNVLSLER
jgi:hypothetical protein